MTDPASYTALLVGAALAGSVLGLVPGFHSNTLALFGLASIPFMLAQLPTLTIQESSALLVAFSMAGAMGAIVPGTILGAYDERQALSALPAQKLFLSGRFHEAVTLSVAGSLAGLSIGLLLVFAGASIFLPPSTASSDLRSALPALLLCATIALVVTEKGAVPYRRVITPCPFGVVRGDGAFSRQTPVTGLTVTGTVDAVSKRGFVLETPTGRVRVEDDIGWLDDIGEGDQLRVRGSVSYWVGPWSRLLAIFVGALLFVASGLLGLLLPLVHVESPVGFPSSPIFPVLAGLFGLPSLLLALDAAPVERRQQLFEAAQPTKEFLGDSACGAVAGAIVGLLPGVTPAAAATLLSPSEIDAERSIVRFSAAEAANGLAALCALFLLGSTRSGEAAALSRLAIDLSWADLLPGPAVIGVLVGAATAMVVGGVVAVSLSGALVGLIAGGGARRVALLGLALTAVFVLLFTGASGLLLYFVCGGLGTVPLVARVRRTNLLGVLIVPVLVSLWGVGWM
ncbi:MAG: tripartite tricarboxylate transporter permease [Euryarchaeota archaeon]|nr:tripartite tricarboxylate transporter permease [Euryarchaeota archaeon]